MEYLPLVLTLLRCLILSPFEIIGITETKEQWGKGFLTNVSLSGYDVYSQPSKSSAGASAIYVMSNSSHRLRPDLSALEEEFETV